MGCSPRPHLCSHGTPLSHGKVGIPAWRFCNPFQALSPPSPDLGKDGGASPPSPHGQPRDRAGQRDHMVTTSNAQQEKSRRALVRRTPAYERAWQRASHNLLPPTSTGKDVASGGQHGAPGKCSPDPRRDARPTTDTHLSTPPTHWTPTLRLHPASRGGRASLSINTGGMTRRHGVEVPEQDGSAMGLRGGAQGAPFP